jgi:hypothetical protein
MSRPVGLSSTVVAAVRTVTGAPVAADSTSLTDENFSTLPDNVLGGAVNCFGFSTVWVAVEYVGGTSPAVILDPLVRDDGAATDGNRWKRYANPTVVYTLDPIDFVEVRVDGRLIYPRLASVTGSPTGVTLLAFPGLRLPGRIFQ